MNIERLARKCGVKIIRCSAKDWGGHIGYKMAGSPNVAICGFSSRIAAYQHWFDSEFSDRVGKVVRKILERHPRRKHG